MFLVVGANGQLGNELKLILGGNAEYVDREQLDITDAAAVKAFVKPENMRRLSTVPLIRRLTRRKAMRFWPKNQCGRPAAFGRDGCAAVAGVDGLRF